MTIATSDVIVTSTTAAQLITRAYRRLQAIDLHEQPSDTEMSNGLSALEEFIDGLGADSIPTATQTLTATVTDDSAVLSSLDTTANLCPGMNISGTGIATSARVSKILSATSIEMTADATASGSAVSITFTFLPFHIRHRSALVAIMATYMAGDTGLPDAAPRVVQDAIEGKYAILAQYIQTPFVEYDRALANPRSNEADTLFDS